MRSTALCKSRLPAAARSISESSVASLNWSHQRGSGSAWVSASDGTLAWGKRTSSGGFCARCKSFQLSGAFASGGVKFGPTEHAPASIESSKGIKRLLISMPSPATRGFHRRKEKCDRHEAQRKDRHRAEHVEVGQDRGLQDVLLVHQSGRRGQDRKSVV